MGSLVRVCTLRVTGALVVVFVAGCGARATVDASESELGLPGMSRQPAPESPPPGFDPGGAPPSRPNDPARFDTAELGECVPGYPERGGRGELLDCPFKFNGLCHEDWEAACACACPRVQHTQCVATGLFDPGPLEVRCYAD